MSKYIMGIDGGNSKTDICIFDDAGNFITHQRFGSCSHEVFEEGFPMAKKKLNEFVQATLTDCNLTLDDIHGAAMGLAGVDLPWQEEKMSGIVSDLGFKNFSVSNDGFLGIKVGSDDGTGICSINGTGTVCVGIDSHGTTMQVGGIGQLFGDDAGGRYIAGRAIRRVYDTFYRSHPPTAMAEPMLKLFDCDKRLFAQTVIEQYFPQEINDLDVLSILFDCADQGDQGAIDVLNEAAFQLACSVGGCIRELDFQDTVNIFLAGSVWSKASTPIIQDCFVKHLSQLTDLKLNITKLDARPVAGAVIWAYELLHGAVPSDVKNTIVETIEQHLD